MCQLRHRGAVLAAPDSGCDAVLGTVMRLNGNQLWKENVFERLVSAVTDDAPVPSRVSVWRLELLRIQRDTGRSAL